MNSEEKIVDFLDRNINNRTYNEEDSEEYDALVEFEMKDNDEKNIPDIFLDDIRKLDIEEAREVLSYALSMATISGEHDALQQVRDLLDKKGILDEEE